jgi:hypothetical protein
LRKKLKTIIREELDKKIRELRVIPGGNPRFDPAFSKVKPSEFCDYDEELEEWIVTDRSFDSIKFNSWETLKNKILAFLYDISGKWPSGSKEKHISLWAINQHLFNDQIIGLEKLISHIDPYLSQVINYKIDDGHLTFTYK